MKTPLARRAPVLHFNGEFQITTRKPTTRAQLNALMLSARCSDSRYTTNVGGRRLSPRLRLRGVPVKDGTHFAGQAFEQSCNCAWQIQSRESRFSLGATTGATSQTLCGELRGAIKRFDVTYPLYPDSLEHKNDSGTSLARSYGHFRPLP